MAGIATDAGGAMALVTKGYLPSSFRNSDLLRSLDADDVRSIQPRTCRMAKVVRGNMAQTVRCLRYRCHHLLGDM